jgi:hypothetical protein
MRERCGILSHVAGTKRSCLFCGSQEKLTKEHVFPKWLRRALSAERIGFAFGPPGTAPLDFLSVTLREVCAACNHGWLHDLEHAFRALMLPAIEGRSDSLTLSTESQTVIAVWAVKTWFLVQRGLAHFRGGAWEGDVPRVLRSENEPPDRTQVWIARTEPRDDHLITISSHNVIDEAGEEFGGMGYLVLGGLVVVVFATMNVRDGRWQGIRPDPAAFHQIWPHETEEVLWPPSVILTPEILREVFPPNEPIIL